MADTLRPHMVRADTIDLQDHHNPSAADHSPRASSDGFAPHQAASLHHVAEERHSEERSLADAWSSPNQHTEEPDSDSNDPNEDESTLEQSDHITGDQEADDLADSDGEGDDDLADRISSSPSIDDGAFIYSSSPPLPATCWTPRDSDGEVFTPPSTPIRPDFNSSVDTLCESTLQHVTLFTDVSGSVTDDSPFSHASKHHHFMGRYTDPSPGSGAGYDNNDYDFDYYETEDDYWEEDEETLPIRQYSFEPMEVIDEAASESAVNTTPTRQPWRLPFRRRYSYPSLSGLPISGLEQSPSMTSIGSVNLSDILLPVNDPLLENPPSPTDSSSSWETLSDDNIFDNTRSMDAIIDDDVDAIFFDLSNRYIESAGFGLCLRETEDIDFEFVYALHTFVATVEGQANATKGDTMVLLDDTNSYWWLVRVVKDSSIGYLPAEHIETPTERLARLNKHRNIDLSATMLGDNNEKSRNPIKKAMRRRNAKTVQFAAPTYVEASDYEYSDDEEDQSNLDKYPEGAQDGEVQQEGAQDGERSAEDEAMQNHETETKTPLSAKRTSFDREQAATAAAAAAAAAGAGSDEPQLSPKLVDRTEAAPLKSRKGTARNADSFLKDDMLETRKITLTPGLLREDNGSTKSTSTESTRNPSLDALVKQVSPPEPQPPTKKEAKEKKKEKQKEKQKGGMLSGLFKSKKKDKKAKDEAASNEQTESEKASSELTRNDSSPKSSPMASENSSPIDSTTSRGSPVDMNKPSPVMRLQNPPQGNKLTKPNPALQNGLTNGSGFVAELPGSEVAHEMSSGFVPVAASAPMLAPEKEVNGGGPLSPLTNMLRSASSGGGPDSKAKEPKPKKAKRSKRRVQLDDFDSPAQNVEEEEDEEEEVSSHAFNNSVSSDTSATFMHGTEIIHIPTPGAEDGPMEEDETEEDSASEDDTSASGVDSSSILDPHPAEHDRSVEPINTFGGAHEPVVHAVEIPEDNDATPTGPRSPEPTVDAPAAYPPMMMEPAMAPVAAAPTESILTPHGPSPLGRSLDSPNTASTTPSTFLPASSPTPRSPTPRSPATPATPTIISSRNTPTPGGQAPAWSDARLRTWLDDGSDVKDLLVLVRDRSGVVPVSADHPMMAGLYSEPKKGVQDMMGQLDGLLSGFLERKGVVLN